jgi:hypothetical protein
MTARFTGMPGGTRPPLAPNVPTRFPRHCRRRLGSHSPFGLVNTGLDEYRDENCTPKNPGVLLLQTVGEAARSSGNLI